LKTTSIKNVYTKANGLTRKNNAGTAAERDTLDDKNLVANTRLIS